MVPRGEVEEPMKNGDLAQRYRAWRKRTLGVVAGRLEMAAILEFLGPVEGKRVLDAGCGDGAYSLAATERGALVTGVDLSEELLAAARARGGAPGGAGGWGEGGGG